MLESALNHFSDAELFNGTGIQAVINKLNSIKHNPTQREADAVIRFAGELARLEVNEKAEHRYIIFDSKSGSWRGKRSIFGKVFYRRSKDKKVVLDAYYRFCKEQGLM